MAARHWAAAIKRHSGGGDQRADDLAALPGVDADEAAAWLRAQEMQESQEAPEAAEWDPIQLGQPFPVWRENWSVTRLWLQVQTQWRWDEDRRPRGLRFEALQAVVWASGAGRKTRRRHFEQLVDMQHAVLEAWDGV